MFGRATITLGIDPHSSFLFNLFAMNNDYHKHETTAAVRVPITSELSHGICEQELSSS